MRHFFSSYLELLIPVLAHFPFQSVLLIPELSIFNRIRVNSLESLQDFFELVCKILFLLFDFRHHALELFLSLDLALIFQLSISVDAAAEIGTEFGLCLLAHLEFGFLSALSERNYDFPFKLGDGTVVQEVQS